MKSRPPAAEPLHRNTARDTVNVLLDRNFFPYLLANTLSGIGSSFQMLAQSILMFRLTGSTFMLGVLGFAQLAAVFFLAPWTGSAADRHERRRVIAFSESSAVITMTLLTITAASGHAGELALILFAVVLGARTALSSPSAMALVPSLVQPRFISAALALNSVTFNVGRAVGPVAAALVIHTLGTTWCFGMAAVLSAPLAFGILFVKPLIPHVRSLDRPRFRESVKLVAHDRRLAGLLYVIAAVAVCTDPPVTLGPAFMTEALHRHDTLAGVLIGAFGMGAIVAAFTVSHRLRGTRTAIAGTLALAALGTATYAFAPSFAFALGFLLILGFGYLSTNVGATSRLQLAVAPEQRGRVMALWTAAFLGVRPLGSLVDGSVASVAGVRVASFLMAVPAMIGVAALLLTRARRARVVAEEASSSA
jgi:MFS family permease